MQSWDFNKLFKGELIWVIQTMQIVKISGHTVSDATRWHCSVTSGHIRYAETPGDLD